MKFTRQPVYSPVFKDMNDGVCRPFALIGRGVVAAGAARPAVFQRPRRWDLLLRKHTGNLGRAIPARQSWYICWTTGAVSLVNEIVLVLVHEVAIYRLAGNRLSTHAFCSFYCFDFLARISHQPFVEQISQRGKIVVPCRPFALSTLSLTAIKRTPF